MRIKLISSAWKADNLSLIYAHENQNSFTEKKSNILFFKNQCLSKSIALNR